MPQDLAGLDELSLATILSGSPFCQAILVCDGNPKPGVPSGQLAPGVQAIYSGKTRTADSLLIQILKAHSAPKQLTVVSSDRQIFNAAAARKAKAITSQAFIRDVHRLSLPTSSKPQSTGKPRGQLTPNQVQDWLKAFGIDD